MSFPPLETPHHLYQPARYSHDGVTWGIDVESAILAAGRALSWDATALLSVLTFNYAPADRTLFSGIRRQPWLSKAEGTGVELQEIPRHDVLWDRADRIGAHLHALLRDEVARACQGRSELYVLLSGGLDSRIVAGVLHELVREGHVTGTPVAVTWGVSASRDVEYGRALADILGFEWRHVPLGPADLVRNVREGARAIGGLVPPNHLHAMLWFGDNAGRDALVLAGSYGDSVGRAEYSKMHVLELRAHELTNPYGLATRDALEEARHGLVGDVAELRERIGVRRPDYAEREIEMHCWYTRGMLAHTMNVVNRWCTLYQVFTAPDVYSYMWSLHPARRDDEIYAVLLSRLDPVLARTPWARTNRALAGQTVGASRHGLREHHDYPTWTRRIHSELGALVDPEWFEATGVFTAEGVRLLNDAVASDRHRSAIARSRATEIWLWLAGLRQLTEQLRVDLDARVAQRDEVGSFHVALTSSRRRPTTRLRRALRANARLYRLASSVRRRYVRSRSRRRYPPIPVD